MFRRFLVAVLIFLIAIVVVADRVGAIVAGHVLASKVKNDEHLPGATTASVGGFPFLTQAIGGKYSDVKITSHDVLVSGVPVTTLSVQLHGVHIPLSNIVRGSVSHVPVDRVAGTAFVSFADANSYLASHHPLGQLFSLRAAPDNGLTVVLRLTKGGKGPSLTGVGTISVSGNVVKVGVTRIAARAGGTAFSSSLALALKDAAVSFPLQALPFQLHLTSVAITPAGISGAGTARNIVLGSL